MCAKRTTDPEGRTLVYKGEGDRTLQRYVDSLSKLERMMHHSYSSEMELVSLRLRLGISGSAETLVVITVINEEGTRYVGFHSSYNCLDALSGAIDRVYDGKVRWREDEYQQGSPGG